MTPDQEPEEEQPPEDQRQQEPEYEPPYGMPLRWAMLAYVVLALLALLTLDGKFLAVVLILLAGFAVKSYLATLHRD